MDSSKEHSLTTFTTSGTHILCFHFKITDQVTSRWKPFDSTRNWPDLGFRFTSGERMIRAAAAASHSGNATTASLDQEDFPEPTDKLDLGWATILKRTFEAYIRGEQPNMYGEWLQW